MTLGKYPTLALAEARELALEAIRNAKRGIDAQDEKVVARRGMRFDETVDQFVRTHCAQHNRKSTEREIGRILRVRFVRRWGARDVREITRSDVLEVLDGAIADGTPSAANHALAAVRVFFNWCLDRGLIEATPCARMKRPAKIGSRERVLSDLEIGYVWNAAKVVGYPFGTIVQLLLLTGQRRNEVTTMRWADINLERGVWTIPGELTKNGVVQDVPLVREVREIIEGIPRVHQELVFPARGSEVNTFSGFSKSKKVLDGIANVEGWTLHDLRRTLSTHVASLGVAPHVVERLLNHISGLLGSVAGIYNRYRYLNEVRAALELWTAHVMQLSERPAMAGAVGQ